jgi:hypothetical protein
MPCDVREPAAFERGRPLLDAVAKRVLYTGQIGSGSIAKIMHNSASFTLDEAKRSRPFASLGGRRLCREPPFRSAIVG